MLTSIPLERAFSLDGLKHDTNDLSIGSIRAFSVNVAGNVAYVTTRGDEGVLSCVVGVIYYLEIKRLKTGTTATGVYGYR